MIGSLPLETLDPALRAALEAEIREGGGGPERLVSLLHLVQETLGHVPEDVQELLADRLGLSPVQVGGVVSYFPYFSSLPRGRFHLRVCSGTTCFVRSSGPLLELLRFLLRPDGRGLSADGLFSLERVRCLGACALAPALMVNGRVHGRLTGEGLRGLIEGVRAEAGDTGLLRLPEGPRE
jgi:NADH-quinone oxidoreductase subunit E/NADP-reducing hydrogenase subunit HndA